MEYCTADISGPTRWNAAKWFVFRHLLPESPPDSSSEYSPQDGGEPALNASETIYSSLGTSNYKPELLNPIHSLILPSQIIADQNNERLVDNNDLLQVPTLKY